MKAKDSSDFKKVITVEKTSKQAFDAINNPLAWWSENIDGSSTKEGDEFLYHHKDVHFTKIRIEELVPGQRVVWFVVKNYFNFTIDKTEWNNTRIIFDIQEKNGKTEIVFTHEGLVPESECFEACSSGWTYFITESLRQLIETGKGKPNPKEGGFNEELVRKLNLHAA